VIEDHWDANETEQSVSISPAALAEVAAVLGLVLVTLAVYWPGRETQFVNRDDPFYVTGNTHVSGGLSAENVRWAWTSFEWANWFPLTWLSLQLDAQLYGVSAYGFRITNLLVHVANVVLLFWVWRRLSGSAGPSLLVAGLFALHPLHVESVAWVTERKDVLSTLFWMLTLWAYVCYTEKPGVMRFLCVFAALALGLMAKPMLVTLPCVLFLLDYWPLGRLGKANLRLAILEKVPLFLLSAASSVVTVVAQSRGQAIAALDDYPLADRLANVIVSFAAYLVQMVWPLNLAVYYPFEHLAWSDGRVWGSGLLLAGITMLVVSQAIRRPYLLVGWLWYLGTLVPVIGLVQVGSAARADRYTYVPLIGVFVMIAWSAAEVARWCEQARRWVWAGAGVALLGCVVLTWVQVGHWHDSFTLWRHALAVTGPNADAHSGLGAAYRDNGDLSRAVEEFRKAVEAKPSFVHARTNLGWCLFSLRKYDEARDEFERILQTDPDNVNALFQLGVIAGVKARPAEAMEWYGKVLRLRPDDMRARFNLAIELLNEGQHDAALRQLEEIEREQPQVRKVAAFQAAMKAAKEKKGGR
jgi:Tfp pilus assembly protein PilF